MGTRRAYRITGAMAALIIVSGCASAPRFTGRGAGAPASEITRSPVAGDSMRDGAAPGALGSEVVRHAQNYLGTPYRNGGTSANGLDCSGLTFSVYRSFGINLPRTSQAQSQVGVHVPRHDIAVGDLLFFGSGSSVSHVGIYAGEGEFIHASTRSRSVRFDRLDNKYFRKRYVTARRVL